jgi:hypothetical protein
MDKACNFYGAASMGGKKSCSEGFGTLCKLGKNGNGSEPNGWLGPGLQGEPIWNNCNSAALPESPLLERYSS